MLAKVIFWTCAALFVYVYVGYPALLWLIRRVYRKPVRKADITPYVTIAITAHNEEAHIGQRLDNCLSLDYPRERMEILVASDGSTDRTAEIVRAYTARGVRLLELSRVGKARADNALIAEARGEIIITTSATGYYRPDFVRKIVRNFADPEVGAVTGVYQPHNAGESSTSATESVYYRYEMFIRQLESDLGILATSGGVALGFRRDLFVPLHPASDMDNMIPLHVVTARKRVVFEPEAIAHDDASTSPEEQFRQRVRSVTRSLRDRLRMRHLLNPFQYPGPAFSLWSHKLLRWGTPFFLLGLLISNAFLLDQPLYRIFFVLQLGFYLVALIGFLWRKRGDVPRLLALPLHVVVVHTAFLLGIVNVLRGQEITMWDRIPAERAGEVGN